MLKQSDPPITGTILVADDQAANRELLEELLTSQGSKGDYCAERRSCR